MFDRDLLATASGADLTAEDLDLDAYLEINPDGTRRLRLAYPFAITVKRDGGPKQEETVDQLHFRRPKAGHLDLLANATDRTALRDLRTLMAALTGVEAKLLGDNLDGVDFMRAAMVVAGFFPTSPSRATGERSPAS